MKIKYMKPAQKTISKLDRGMKSRLKQAIEQIPFGDIKPLKGGLSQYRLRVGSLRIIFSYLDSETIVIEKIAPRGDAYKGGLLK